MVLQIGAASGLPEAEDCLQGREQTMPVPESHCVFGTSFIDLDPQLGQMIFGMGCFWGAERLFWQLPGVVSTAVGYAGGHTPNPLYDEVCSGRTGHTEVVKVVYDQNFISLQQLLVVFWERHDPTQGFRQGNDIGSQYRSALYFVDAPSGEICLQSALDFQQQLSKHNKNQITTEINRLKKFYFAESYHQQYLAKNPHGYCGLAGTGVKCM